MQRLRAPRPRSCSVVAPTREFAHGRPSPAVSLSPRPTPSSACARPAAFGPHLGVCVGVSPAACLSGCAPCSALTPNALPPERSSFWLVGSIAQHSAACRWSGANGRGCLGVCHHPLRDSVTRPRGLGIWTHRAQSVSRGCRTSAAAAAAAIPRLDWTGESSCRLAHRVVGQRSPKAA